MNKIKLLIAHNNNKIIEEIKEFTETLENIKIIGEATSGQEILNKAIELKPDVVFVKYDMKDINGIEVMRKVQEELKDETPTFKFISDDLSTNIGKSTYEAKNKMNVLVKEYGKEGIIEFLKCH